MGILDRAIEELEKLLAAENQERARLGASPVPKAQIKVMGQISLLMDPEVRSRLSLAATADVDAVVSGDGIVRTFFKEILEAQGLELDDLSTEVWIPPEATFKTYHDSPALTVSYLNPLATLTSKAVKAKEKNLILIREALEVYGEQLALSISRNGGQVEYFRGIPRLKF